LYPNFLKSAENNKPAENAIKCALEAEKIHNKLFQNALKSLKDNKDIPIEKYYTCSRCGYTYNGAQPPNRCPACGTDRFKFYTEGHSSNNPIIELNK